MTTNPEPTIVTLSSPPDIVSLVPIAVGFHPCDSLVVISLRGPRKRQGLTMRVDLPPPEYHRELATDMAGRVGHDGADSVIIVVYTDEPDDGPNLPRSDLIDALHDELGDRAIGRTEVLLVRAGRWHSYACDLACCPREGTAFGTSTNSELLGLEARNALDGRVVLRSRAELEASIRGPVAIREFALNVVYDRQRRVFGNEVVCAGADAALDRTLELARTGLERFRSGDQTLTDDEAVRILVGLEDTLARDAMITWGLDGETAELVVFLSALARCALDEYAAPICTVLACVAYQAGSGALANIAIERAQRSEPDYEMTRLLDFALQAQVDPGEIRSMAGRTRDRLRELGIATDGLPRAA